MINLAPCPVCPHPNYLEASALALHVAVVHVPQMAVAQVLPADQNEDHA